MNALCSATPCGVLGQHTGGLTFLHKRIPALVSKVARVAQVQTLWCFSVPFFS
ncbi:hypothetical protein AcetOrient_orf02379 [Acetobacter orientalis]|uniref:Uncharacterized protein n=1 Tax=Acetobacter orientalis TaxID=146474 RepID=A0A2Z5ZHT5_9PROT|nr:hypothetical protein AcetOrient_orf02379 [Acetobacter orientalis]